MRHFDDIASKFETALNQAYDELMEKGFVKHRCTRGTNKIK